MREVDDGPRVQEGAVGRGHNSHHRPVHAGDVGVGGLDQRHLKGVEDGIRLLEKTNYGEPAFIGKRVAILGAGFTAMDCCRTSMRYGAEKVYVMYRRSKEEQPSDEYEVDEAVLENVEFQYLVTQSAVTTKDGIHASGVRFVRNTLGDPDAGGRRRPIPIPNSEFEIEVDTVIPAFGQYSDASWLQAEELNLEVNKYGVPLVDYDSWMTSYSGLFAGGDYTQGARNLISAIGDGRDAAGAINRYLGGVDKPPTQPYLCRGVSTAIALILLRFCR